MSDQDPIGEQFAELGLRPATDDEAGDEMQIGTRVNVVRDASRDDQEDGRGALAADVEPVSWAEDQPPELALATIVSRLDVAVFEEKQESIPLSMEIPKSTAERGLGRDDLALMIRPAAQLIEDGAGLLIATRPARPFALLRTPWRLRQLVRPSLPLECEQN